MSNKEFLYPHQKEALRKMFDGYQFSYDLYSRTMEDYHKDKVKKLFRRLYDNG